MNRPNDLITPKSAAKEIGLSVDSLYRRIHDGTLRSWTIGSRFRVSRADVLNLFEPYEPDDKESEGEEGTPSLVSKVDRERQINKARETLRAAGALAS